MKFGERSHLYLLMAISKGLLCIWASSSSGFGRQPPLQPCHKARKGQSDCSTESSQLEYVKPPFPAFAFTDEGLRFPQAGSQLNLRNPGPLPSSPKLVQENPVIARCNAFFHGPCPGARL
jgi:hypothetical protein